MKDTNPIDSLERVLAFSSKDWAFSADDAWIYGIILGWDKESLNELSEQHGWSQSAIEKLKTLHRNFVSIKNDERIVVLEKKLDAIYNTALECGADPEYMRLNFANTWSGET